MKICACISGKTVERCIDILESVDTEMVEHRMDLMGSIEGLAEIYGSTDADVIATNRSEDEGGAFTGTEEERIGYLLEAVDAGCDFVDIEMDTEEDLREKVMEYAKDNGCSVIISKHNFDGTPILNDLIEIMEEQMNMGADIGKIVTYAKDPHDCHTIFDLLIHADEVGFDLVAFAMGELGRKTRVIAPMYGAPFMYACIHEPVADGQLDVDTLKDIWEGTEIG